MLNFGGKSSQWSKSGPTEIDFHSFWKNLDETYFVLTSSRDLKEKEQEMARKIRPFTQNHHHDHEILAELRTDMQRVGAKNYSQFFFHHEREEVQATQDGLQPIIQAQEGTTREPIENTLFGYKILAIPCENSEEEKLETIISIKEEKLLEKIKLQQESNEKSVKKLQEKIDIDDLSMLAEMRNQTKENQFAFLKNEIIRLECKQLAESIVSIKEITGSKQNNSNTINQEESRFYELQFDEAIHVPTMSLDYENVKLLAKYHQGALITSPYDANIASAMQFPSSISPPKEKSVGVEPNVAPSELPKPIKQILNFFDAEVMNREINFKEYGLCHHCKEIKPRNQLVQCNYRSNYMEIPMHKGVISQGGNKGKKHGQRSLGGAGKHKKVSKDQEYSCERLFCYICISLNYDQSPSLIMGNPSWICPHCQCTCYCSRCVRQEQLVKLRSLFVSLGGLTTDLEDSSNILNSHAARNIQEAREIISKTKFTPFNKSGSMHSSISPSTKLSKSELKKLKKKLNMLKKIRETIDAGKELIKLVDERERVKKDILVSAFATSLEGTPQASVEVEEQQSKPKKKKHH